MDAQIAQNGAGDYALGFTIDGAFVPLATVAGFRVGHLVERQATLKARADDPSHEGNGPALDALESDWRPIVSPPSQPATTEPTETTSTETPEA